MAITNAPQVFLRTKHGIWDDIIKILNKDINNSHFLSGLEKFALELYNNHKIFDIDLQQDEKLGVVSH